MKEDQLRINLLETKLQNESLKQDADRLRSGTRPKGTEILKVPILPSRPETDPGGDQECQTLKEENQKLMDENVRLYDQLLSEIQLRKEIEKEKQELFRQLLKKDPETGPLLEEEEDPDKKEEPGKTGNGEQDPPEEAGGERSEES